MSIDLTDEQIDESAEHYEAMAGTYVMIQSDGRSARHCFRDWLAAVEARAAKRERSNMAAIRAEDRALIVRFMRELRPRETRTDRYATGFRATIDLMIARTEATVDA